MPTSTPVRRQRRRRSRPSPAVCRTCKETFPSRNALFAHINKELHFLRSRITSKSFRPVVASKAPQQKVGTGTAFKDFNYCEVRYQLSPKSPNSESWGCADTGSGMSLVDESVIQSIPESSGKTRHSNSPVHIKGVGDEMYLSKESLVLDVFFPDVTNTRLAKITREFHIVQDMDCGLLIGNDIIEPEGIVIDLAKKRMQISACNNMVCQLKVRRKQRDSSHLVIRCAQATVVREGAHLFEQVRIRFPQLEKKYYPFKACSNLPKGCRIFQNELSEDWTKIIVNNWSDKDVTIPKDFKLGYIELPEPPQYTPIKLVDVVQCHFRKAAEPQEQLRSSTVTNEVSTASIGTTPSRQVPKKTSSPCESAPKMSPKSARCPPSLLRSSVPSPPSLRTAVPSFSPVHSSRSPLCRSPFFFYRPQYFSFSFPPPSTTYQGNNDRLGLYSYLLCRRPPSFPPKPGWQ